MKKQFERQPRVKERLKDKAHVLYKATPRLGNIDVSSNIQKQIQGVKQNEEMEEYVPTIRTI